jgi:protein SCO1/2
MKTQPFPSMKSLLALIAALFISANLAAADTTATNRSCCVQLSPTTPSQLTDNSLFHLDSTWTNDAARPVKLVSFQGRPHVVTMFFSSCAYACPILVHDMKRIEAALPENIRTNVGFVLISFDTDRDTPPVLADFRARHQLPANWTLLRGGTDDVLELAALLGIKFKKDARGDFAHSNVISLLDQNGEILLQQIGLNRDPAPVSSAVENLLKPATP